MATNKIVSFTKAKEILDKACETLEAIPQRECTENANRKIDEALSYCYMAKDKI